MNVPLGTTPTGADWCIKALHPADPLTEVRGIPDHSAVPTVCMNYQTTATFGCNAAAVGTWSFDATLLPHPVDFMYVDVVDSVVPLGVSQNILNTQLTGATHYEKYAAFKALCQRWRLAYMSVTMYQDGPDLANQGTLVAAQTPVQPRMFPITWTSAGFISVGSGTGNKYTIEDLPSFTNSQAMPNAYFNRSREGCYVPLKLTETCQDWQSETSQIYLADCNDIPPGVASKEFMTIPVGTVPAYPHTTLQPLYINPGVSVAGEPTSAMLNGTWAHICGKNLAVTTSISVFIRVGIEMQVMPSSTISPQLKLSPPYDPVALDAYFKISRELKDGYPANYNDLGKIWDVISKAGRSITPFLGAFGPYGAAAGSIGTSIFDVGDEIRARRKAKKSGGGGRMDPVTRADVERAQDQQTARAVLASAPPPVNRKTKPKVRAVVPLYQARLPGAGRARL